MAPDNVAEVYRPTVTSNVSASTGQNAGVRYIPVACDRIDYCADHASQESHYDNLTRLCPLILNVVYDIPVTLTHEVGRAVVLTS